MSGERSAFCPRCGALRADGPECPACGVIYAKARPRAGTPAPPPQPPPVGAGDARGLLPGQTAAVWRGELDAARRELRIRLLAPPLALLLAFVLVSSGAGRALVRTFFSMWLHELGHAASAWLCGFAAVPGPWRTPVSQARSALVVILLGGGLAALAAWGHRARRPPVTAAALAAGLAQLVCTLLPLPTARALFTFGGDAGCLVLGAALVASLWTDPEGPLGRGWLRWGLLFIGACAFADTLSTWLRAAADHDQIPLGRIEGVGLSDASTLWQVHGWSLSTIAERYVALGIGCLVALAIGHAVAVRRARARLRAPSRAAAAPPRP